MNGEALRNLTTTRIVDCGQTKYYVHLDCVGLTLFECIGTDQTVLRFVDIPAFHAAAIADAIVAVTAEHAADVAKLKGGAA